MPRLRLGKVHLVMLFLAPLLSACALLQPPQQPPVTPVSPLSELSQHRLLQELHQCGQPDSLNCAKIHSALAEWYLSSGALNHTALNNATRELSMAAQNHDIAMATRPLRRTLSALIESRNAAQHCALQLRAAKDQTATAQANATTAQSRLQRLEALLHHHAEKSLQKPSTPLP